ncbi:hypothetical protein [Streptomyces sp. NPDC057293]|uniref:hypothetical protein n=1 Tax=unclassified Streptomyces TaxID=2593676 RepID=UPI0036380F04
MTTLHLPPMPGDADPVIIPGLRAALGIDRDVDPDFKESIDKKLTESYEDYCQRITKGAGLTPANDTVVRAKIARLKRQVAELEQQIAAAHAALEKP